MAVAARVNSTEPVRMSSLLRASLPCVLGTLSSCTVVAGNVAEEALTSGGGALPDASAPTPVSSAAGVASGGSGGAGGPASVGGEPADSASPVPTQGAPDASDTEPECVDSIDCDDGIQCNGQEQCVAGSCAAGTPVVCPVPDETHCSAGCIEGVGCVVFPLDDDDDGFDSSACPGAAGDDCDDTRADVNPGAVEVCDGVDHDCDGVQGVSAGFDASGSVVAIDDWRDVAIDWFDAEQRFQLATSQSRATTEDRVFLGEITTSGVVTTSDQARLAVGDAEGANVASIVVLEDGSRIVGTLHGGPLGNQGQTVTVRVSGASDDRFFGRAFGVDVAGRGTDAVAVRTHLSEIGVHVVPDANATLPAVLGVSNPRAPRITSGEESSAIVWEHDDGIFWSRVTTDVFPAPDAGGDSRLVASEPAPLSETGVSPDIVAVAGGYAVAWRDPHGVTLTIVDESGQERCVPSTHIFGDTTAEADSSVAIAYGPLGIYVVATDLSSDEVSLMRFDEDCSLVDVAAVGGASVAPVAPAIAVGGGFVGLSWAEGVAYADRVVRTRVMTDVLCE